MLEITPPLLALILVEPSVRVVAKPALSIVATAVPLDIHVVAPKFAAVPSVRVPLAVNCCVFPNMTSADEGVMASVANTGAVTVKVVLLEVTPFAEAVTVVVPCASEVAMPLAFSVATVALLDTQVAAPDTLPVPPSE